jgi:hypothetical protein
VLPALLQTAPAFGGVAEKVGVRGANSRREARTTFIFMEINDKFKREEMKESQGSLVFTLFRMEKK